MRLFIAIQLNDEMKDALTQMQDRMKTWLLREAGRRGTTRQNTPRRGASEQGAAKRDASRHGSARRGAPGNFTSRENLHLTLCFIGEYPDPYDVKDVLETISFEPFPIRLEGIGSFGNLWWAGLEDSEELKTLARRVRRGLDEAYIFHDRKKFSPHITLVRKAGTGSAAIPAEVLTGLPRAEMLVDHISLMRSDRGKHGMIYTEL